VLITDHAELLDRWPEAVMVFPSPQSGARVVLAHWAVEQAHPLGEYLQPLAAVPSVLEPLATAVPSSELVLWAVAGGEKVPLVQTGNDEGRRVVHIALDPTRRPTPHALVLVFLNSLRWLGGSRGLLTTGETISVGPFAPGLVRIQRPNGQMEFRSHGGGFFSEDATDHAGRYQFQQHRVTIQRLVNFLNPVESDTFQRVSTWAPETESPPPPPLTRTFPHSIVSWLIWLVLILLVTEWVMYSRKGRKAGSRAP